MPFYKSPDDLYRNLKILFSQIDERETNVSQTISQSRLLIRLKIVDPPADILLNGRKNPPQVIYGKNSFRPDLDIEITSDALHYILLGQLTFKKALTSKQIKVRGPVWKSFVLEDLFRLGQELYPQLIEGQGK